MLQQYKKCVIKSPHSNGASDQIKRKIIFYSICVYLLRFHFETLVVNVLKLTSNGLKLTSTSCFCYLHRYMDVIIVNLNVEIFLVHSNLSTKQDKLIYDFLVTTSNNYIYFRYCNKMIE